jgi:hypothetical protein
MMRKLQCINLQDKNIKRMHMFLLWKMEKRTQDEGKIQRIRLTAVTVPTGRV